MKIIDELENILDSLKLMDEDNFETEFPKIKERITLTKNEIMLLEKSQFFSKNPAIKEKIVRTTKLISEEYDNKISFWKNKISEISEQLISSRNEKKILSYKR